MDGGFADTQCWQHLRRRRRQTIKSWTWKRRKYLLVFERLNEASRLKEYGYLVPTHRHQVLAALRRHQSMKTHPPLELVQGRCKKRTSNDMKYLDLPQARHGTAFPRSKSRILKGRATCPLICRSTLLLHYRRQACPSLQLALQRKCFSTIGSSSALRL